MSSRTPLALGIRTVTHTSDGTVLMQEDDPEKFPLPPRSWLKIRGRKYWISGWKRRGEHLEVICDLHQKVKKACAT